MKGRLINGTCISVGSADDLGDKMDSRKKTPPDPHIPQEELAAHCQRVISAKSPAEARAIIWYEARQRRNANHERMI